MSLSVMEHGFMLEIDLVPKGDKIPVTFFFDGTTYKGFLSWVPGAAGYCWFLMVNNFYWGTLHLTDGYRWRFTNQKGNMEHLADYFADVVTAWYQ